MLSTPLSRLFVALGLLAAAPSSAQTEDDADSRIPADCHIDWHRHRERPIIDFGLDLAHYFNTYDTTYVERNRYNFRVMATNTDHFQIYRIAGRDDDSPRRQLLSFAPDHTYKYGARVGWRWLNVGYSVSALPGSRRQSNELNFAAYNSRIGCDFNWQHSGGPFHLRRIRGFDGLTEREAWGREVEGISTNTLAFSTYFVFNYRHFAYPAAYNACSRQLRSAGSWMIGANYDYQRFNFDPDAAQETIDATYRDRWPLGGEPPRLYDALCVKSVNYHRIGVNVGYGYNWVPAPGWLVAVSAAPSFGLKKQVGEDISRQMLVDNFRNFHVDCIFRSAVVYNRQRWFAGASAVTYLYDYRHRSFDLNNSVTYLKVYVGLQFHKRKKFRLADESKW